MNEEPTKQLRQGPLECEIGEAFLESTWERDVWDFEAAPFQFVCLLYDYADQAAIETSPFRDLMFQRRAVTIDGDAVTVLVRIDPETLDHETEWTEGQVMTNEERAAIGLPPYSGPNPLPA